MCVITVVAVYLISNVVFKISKVAYSAFNSNVVVCSCLSTQSEFINNSARTDLQSFPKRGPGRKNLSNLLAQVRT